MEPPSSLDLSQLAVTIYCVLPRGVSEAQCSQELFAAYDCCKDNNFNVSFLKESNCLTATPKKEEVYILEKFEGAVFEHLRKSKCTVIGPRCLLVCIHKGEPLPETPYPIFTVAMRGLVVTSTGFSPEEKAVLAEKVHFMGGIYNPALHAGTTHLIVKTVAEFSQKYKVAVSKDIPVMTCEWVEEVWKASCTEDVHASDRRFSRFICPSLKGIVFCVSQIPRNDRAALQKLIESNGGEYSGQLQMGRTHILILPVAEGEKYDYARRWKIHCLKPDWIHDSVEKGYAVEMKNYILERTSVRSSTPEHGLVARSFINTSAISTILNESNARNINETTELSCTAERDDLLELVDLAQVQKAGSFLDGCKVFLSGFEGSRLEKLRKLFNMAGAARFNNISETLTHIIVGSRVDEHWSQFLKLSHKPHIVHVEWVLTSLKMQQPAPEGPHTVPEFQKAQSKKPENETLGKALQGSSFYEDISIVNQYLQAPSQTAAEEQPTETGLFRGLTFYLEDFDDASGEDVGKLITDNGGRIGDSGSIDYSVVSLDPYPLATVFKGRKAVNYLWLEDCVDHEEIVPIRYFHRPVIVKNEAALKGCVIAKSGLDSRERNFCTDLVRAMGGISQETFSRKTIPNRNINACTHLVCHTAEGKKYEAAVAWATLTVRPQWLLACAKQGRRVLEADYPVGAEKIDEEEDIPEAADEAEATQVEEEETRMNKVPEGAPVARTSEKQLKSFPGEFATPGTPYGRCLTENPSPATRKAWKRVIDETVRPSPRSPSFYNHGQSDLDRAVREPDPADDEIVAFFNNLPKRIHLDENPDPGVEEEPAAAAAAVQKAPFETVVAFVHPSLKTEAVELQQIILKLGGKFKLANDASVTHFVYTGKSKTTKDIRQAKEWNQQLVSHYWVLDCEDAQNRLDETLYPCNYNPKMTLSFTVSQSRSSSTQKRAPPPATPRSAGVKPAKKRLMNVEEEQATQPAAVSTQPDAAGPPTQMNEELACQLLNRLEEDLSKINTSEARLSAPFQLNVLPSGDSDGVKKASSQATDPAESQGGASVIWDLTESQAVGVRSANQSPCVVFSSLDQDEREKYAQIVEVLGGTVSHAPYYDEKSTHIVVCRPTRNEKLVSSIAAGKWVIYPLWLDESKKWGYFVDESAYEWGSPAARNLPALNAGTNEALLAAASYRWRLKRKMNHEGPFGNFKAILHLRDKSGAFMRLLTAGGGTVVDAVPPYNETGEANICLVDPKGTAQLDMEALALKGIPCVPVIFLSNILTSKEVSLRDAVIPDFLQFVDKMPVDRGIYLQWKRP